MLVMPGGAILVLGANEVALVIVVIGTQLAQRLAVDNLPQALQVAVVVMQRPKLQVHLARVVVLVGVDVRQHGLVMVAVLVVQHGPGAAAQLGSAAAALDHQLDLGGDVEFGQQVDVVLQGADVDDICPLKASGLITSHASQSPCFSVMRKGLSITKPFAA